MAFSGIRKTQGHDYSYYARITVNWTTFGGSSADGYSPDLIIPFSTQGILLLNETDATVIDVSYNGNTLHDQLNGATTSPTRGIAYDFRTQSLVWLRISTGVSAVFSIRAWAK